MRETLRLSDAPQFREILSDFALRLDGTLSIENVVLSQVTASLKYHDGQEFSYTLDPVNFRVELSEEAQRKTSPINGSSQARIIEYYIRDSDGEWHGPIGTTSIYKDTLGLDPRGNKDLEMVLLDAAHEANQKRLLQKNGDDLRGYGRDNNVQEELLTQAYLDSLRDTDPLHQHLQRLLHSRIPLDREGLKLLRAESRRLTPSQIKAAQVKPDISPQPTIEPQEPTLPKPPITPPPLRSDSGQRSLHRAVVEDLRPHAHLFFGVLPEHLHPW